MARRFHPRSTPGENFRIASRLMPWKALLLLVVLITLAALVFQFATHLGNNVLPGVTQLFYKLSAPPPLPTPTPFPAFPSALPQAGSILYTVQEGDSCDSILTYQMRMESAGEIFSDVKPETVRALNARLGHNCGVIQPGMVLALSPHYPLVALGGEITKIEAATPQQVLPTPLIHVADQEQAGPDCSGGCQLTLRVTPQVTVHLLVQTALSLHVHAWVWTQAMMPRQFVAGFPTYPYVDPKASLNGMSLRSCDLQVDTVHDNDGPSCRELTPNTIAIDHGAWLLAVAGANGLDHWHYPVHLAPGTRVMLWLSLEKGAFTFHPGDPLYRYDDASHVYVKV